YLVAAGCSLTCILLLTPVRPVEKGIRLAGGRSLAALLAGVGFVWHNELLLAAITLDLFAVLLRRATAPLPLFARHIPELGPVRFRLPPPRPPRRAPAHGLRPAPPPPPAPPRPAPPPGRPRLRPRHHLLRLLDDLLPAPAHAGPVGALDNVSVVVRGTL